MISQSQLDNWSLLIEDKPLTGPECFSRWVSMCIVMQCLTEEIERLNRDKSILHGALIDMRQNRYSESRADELIETYKGDVW